MAREGSLCSSPEVRNIPQIILPGRQQCCPLISDGQALHTSLTAPGHLCPPLPNQMYKNSRTGFVLDSDGAQLFLQGRVS